jgi:hypothetical protein
MTWCWKCTTSKHHVEDHEESSCINNSFQCYKENEYCEEAIVEHTAAIHQKMYDQETNEDNITVWTSD